MHILRILGIHGKCLSTRHVQFIMYYIYYFYYWICWDSDIAAASGCPARGRAGQAGPGRPRPGPDPYKNQGFEAGGWRPSETLVAGSRIRPSRISFIIYYIHYIYYGIRWILLKSRNFAAWAPRAPFIIHYVYHIYYDLLWFFPIFSDFYLIDS